MFQLIVGEHQILFFLIYLSTDADRICTPDLITMNSQVVAEYGETVILNCTSPSEDYQDLFLKTDIEEIRNYFEVAVTKWNMKVECVIQLNHSFECKQEFDMVVYSKCHFK